MAVSSGPFCGALGCRDEAAFVMQDGHGEYYVCEEHADAGKVVDDV
jgi:hypothetical protein